MKDRSGFGISVGVANVLGIPVSREDLRQTIARCRERIAAQKGGYVCFVNVHTVTEASRDPGIREALRDAFLRAPDGVPLIWASRLLGEPISERVCGPDFMREFSREQRVCGLIGGADEEVGRAIAAGLGLEATVYSPPFRPFSEENARDDWARFLARCPEGRAPGVIWVGLGAPKQERWMSTVSRLAPRTLFFGVGAAFDFYSGRKKRAPVWMQRAGLEWLYRLIQEPRRMFWRYFDANTRFVFGVAAQRLGLR